MHLHETLSFRRRKLPHWTVRGASYFVTVRCADSLPREAVLRLHEMHASLRQLVPRDPQFVYLQRKLFQTLEKFLDAGHGSCPLANPRAADAVLANFEAMERDGVGVPHFSILPNHWHAIIKPDIDSPSRFAEIMKTIKGRSARDVRKIVGGTGPVWQPEQFDRWIRDEREYQKWVEYIRQNPVKAGLVTCWQEHGWTR
jgi:putative transposase